MKVFKRVKLRMRPECFDEFVGHFHKFDVFLHVLSVLIGSKRMSLLPFGSAGI